MTARRTPYSSGDGAELAPSRILATRCILTTDSDDPRLREGFAALARRREHLIAIGRAHVGWKVGFGSPSGLALLNIDGPIVGILGEFDPIADGVDLRVGGWVAPVVECEVAAIIDRDVPPTVSAEDVHQYVAAWAPAFEFANIDSPPSDVAAVLAGNIFHRGYRLGPEDPSATVADLTSRTATVVIDSDVTHVTDLTALTGDLAEVLARTAWLAPHAGRPVQRGDVVLTGSIVVPIPVRPGSCISYELEGFAAMEVRVA